MKNILIVSLFTAGLLFTSTSGAIVVDFSNTSGHGLNQNKIQINNIRVDNEIDNPFDPSRPEIVSSSYNVPFAFDIGSLHLIPILSEAVIDGPDNTNRNCAILSLNVSNAFTGLPISNASVNIGSNTRSTDENGQVSFTNLLETDLSFIVSAINFNTTSQNTSLNCLQATTLGVALNPISGEGSLDAGEIRIILSWGENPSDLDSHLTGPNSSSTGPNDDTNRFHVYFSNKNDGEGIATLDVDDTNSFGPETITVSPLTGSETLRPGVYRYTVHDFAGSSDIISSPATVRLLFSNGTERTFTPPAGNLTGENDIWTVFEFIVNDTGNLSVLEVNTYGTSFAGSVRSRTYTTTGYGEVEKNIDWTNLPAK